MGTDKAEFRIAEPNGLALGMRSLGKRCSMLSTDVVNTYRVTVFHEDGHPVGKSDLLQRAEASSERPGALTRSLKVLRPGEEMTESFELSEMAQLKEHGNYFVIAVRRLMSWKKGFLFQMPSVSS